MSTHFFIFPFPVRLAQGLGYADRVMILASEPESRADFRGQVGGSASVVPHRGALHLHLLRGDAAQGESVQLGRLGAVALELSKKESVREPVDVLLAS